MGKYRVSIPARLCVTIEADSREEAAAEAAGLAQRADDGVDLADWDTELEELSGVVYPDGEPTVDREIEDDEEGA